MRKARPRRSHQGKCPNTAGNGAAWSETFESELGENTSLRDSLTMIRTTAIEAGQLSQRIRQAVNIVCAEPEPSPRVLETWSEYRRCMQNATDSAWSQIRWPQSRVTEAAAVTPRPVPQDPWG